MTAKEDINHKGRLEVKNITRNAGPTLGRLAGRGEANEVLVEFEKGGPIAARILSGLDHGELIHPKNVGRQVVLIFENNDPELPIIIGLMNNPLEDMVSMEIETKEDQPKLPVEARLDGKRIVLEADDEIELRCGKGSITIRKDGKIVVKGTNLLSRSSGPHRIKGGNVAIN